MTKLLAILFFLLLAAPASATTLYQAEVESTGIGAAYWGLPCTSIPLAELPSGQAAGIVGEAYIGAGCSGPVYIVPGRQLRTTAAIFVDKHLPAWQRRVNRWQTFIFVCTVIVHEVGHLAGHEHSSDPSSVMYPTPVMAFKPCVRRFRHVVTHRDVRKLNVLLAPDAAPSKKRPVGVRTLARRFDSGP